MASTSQPGGAAGAELWIVGRPDTPLPAHVEHAYPPRPSTTGHHGGDHIVIDGALITGRLVRDFGDPLCKPRGKFWGLSKESLDAHASCKRCLQLAALRPAGEPVVVAGTRTGATLPCLAWDGSVYNPLTRRHEWSTLSCTRCMWPLADHAPLARVISYCRRGMLLGRPVPVADEVRGTLQLALVAAEHALAHLPHQAAVVQALSSHLDLAHVAEVRRRLEGPR